VRARSRVCLHTCEHFAESLTQKAFCAPVLQTPPRKSALLKDMVTPSSEARKVRFSASPISVHEYPKGKCEDELNCSHTQFCVAAFVLCAERVLRFSMARFIIYTYTYRHVSGVLWFSIYTRIYLSGCIHIHINSFQKCCGGCMHKRTQQIKMTYMNYMHTLIYVHFYT